jgi:hypothetical protein
MADDNSSAKSNDIDELIRCPCESKEALPHAQTLQEGQQDWVACGNCDVWQHSICVGLLDEFEKNMPEKYFCEECKPELHKRFHFGPGSDDRYDVASERRVMHAMPHTRDEDEIYRKTKWLVTEIDAIAESHPQAVTVEWAKLNGMHADFQAEKKARKASKPPPEPWHKEDFEHMVRLSIRIVLWNASVSAIERFRSRLIKVRFDEAEAVAAELWSLRSWLNVEFMKKMKVESPELGKANVDALRKMGVSLELGKTNVDAVRKYFNKE